MSKKYSLWGIAGAIFSKKLMFSLCAVALAAGGNAYTYSWYSGSEYQDATAQAAEWAVKINGQDITASDAQFDVSFKEVANANVVDGRIAPGSELYADFEIDPASADVAIDYSFELNEITAPVQMSKVCIVGSPEVEINKNSDGKYAGTLTINKKVTVRVYVGWVNDGTGDLGDTTAGISVPVPALTMQAKFTVSHDTHSYSTYISDGAGHWRACACGELIDKAAHTYGAWVVTKEAKEAENGSKERVCTVCGYKDVGIIPAEIPDGLWIANIDSDGYTYTGEAIIPQVRVYDRKTLLVEKVDYTLSIKNNVRANDATNPKTAPTITVTARGNYLGRETATFKILPADIKDCYAEDFSVKIDARRKQTPVPVLYYRGTKLRNKSDFTLTYDNESNIYASEGEYFVTVTGKGNYAGTREMTLTAVGKPVANPALSMSRVTVPDFVKSFTYTGGALEQESALKIKLSSKVNGKTVIEERTLVKGEHYTVGYANNIKAGTATVTYYGKNGYSGKLRKTYRILQYDIGINDGNKITYDMASECIYAKGGAKPKPVVKFDGKTMVEGVDYTLSYKYNTAVNPNLVVVNRRQPACVTITGRGNFKGKISINFTIAPQDLKNMTLVPCDKVYQKRANIYKITPRLTDVDGKQLSSGRDYDTRTIKYTYVDNVTFANGTTKMAGDEVEKTDIIPAGTSIRITLKSGTGGNYTGEFSGTYRITQASINSASVKIPQQAYTGSEIKPDKTQLVVKVGKITLTGDDYDIVGYVNNVKRGTAYLIIEGRGNYGGTRKAGFAIKAKGFSWWWR